MRQRYSPDNPDNYRHAAHAVGASRCDRSDPAFKRTFISAGHNVHQEPQSSRRASIHRSRFLFT